MRISDDKMETQDSVSFKVMVEGRMQEARRSIIVQVHSEQSCSELHSYCNHYGTVKTMHHYTLPEKLHFVIVEFGCESDVRNILEVSGHTNSDQVIPVRSPFLWFRAGSNSKTKQPTGQDTVPPVIQHGNRMLTDAELRQKLLEAESMSEQMVILHRHSRLDDLGTRLRFLSARQLELALSGFFPKVRGLPFGSSVNGFGRLGCDLDLILQLDHATSQDVDGKDLRLVFHAKTSMANGRTQVQRHMETIGDVLQLFLPGCASVKRILQARVPIVKYRQELTGVECDLSMTNMTAMYMSELLYMFGEADPRVRPLVFAVRAWARNVGLTNPTPGRWVTNFSLTLLVLFYLQQRNPVLPSLNTLISIAGPEDRQITSDGINCTFVRDVSKLMHHIQQRSSRNTETLDQLLAGFFEFYSLFDFNERAISLADGLALSKPEHAALYIVNPLERGLNVSKNVSPEETERLKMELRNAAWTMESVATTAAEGPWGIVALLEAKGPAGMSRGQATIHLHTRQPRLMQVSELFAEGEAMNPDDTAVNVARSPLDDAAQPAEDLPKTAVNTTATMINITRKPEHSLQMRRDTDSLRIKHRTSPPTAEFKTEVTLKRSGSKTFLSPLASTLQKVTVKSKRTIKAISRQSKRR